MYLLQLIRQNKIAGMLLVLFTSVFLYLQHNGQSYLNNLSEQRIKPNAYGSTRHK